MALLNLWIHNEISLNKYFKNYGRIKLACCMLLWLNAKIKERLALIAQLVCSLLISNLGLGQNPNIQNDSLYSNILKEQRTIQIIFPKKYSPNSMERFDVLYVLDGEWNTSLAEKLYDFLDYAKFIPANMIIVSIPNFYKNGINMRDRDFTPTLAQNGAVKINPISGGANNFVLFLKDELLPFVNRKYPTKSENNILYGTSSGGLFAIYAYLHEPTLFKSYLTVEPSLWWDKEYITKIASEKLENIKGIRNTLWISSCDGGAQVGMGITRF